MWPATLPITLRLIAATTLSSSELPATTSRPPKKMMPPTMIVLRRLANRLRNAICATTPSVASQALMRAPSPAAPRTARAARRPASSELAVGEPDDRVRVRHHALIVGREDERRLLGPVQLLHEIQDVLAGHRVEVRGRLVGEHDARARDQRARDGDALALAARQLAGPVAGVLAQPDPVQQRRHALRALGARQLALQQQRQLDVLEHAEHRHQVEALEDEADRVQAQGRSAAAPTGWRVSLPSTSTVPDVGVSTQPIRLSSVVLPLPDGPAMAMKSPSTTSSVTPRSAGTTTLPSV